MANEQGLSLFVCHATSENSIRELKKRAARRNVGPKGGSRIAVPGRTVRL
jgi:hypothetical protein